MPDDRLTLLASDPGDLPVLSALMQDAIVRAGDIGWDRRRRRLVLVASRYRWEAATEVSRVRTALRLDSVLRVERQHWPADPDAMLALLSIAADSDRVTLSFADAASLRLHVECVDAVLEDLSAPWGVRHRPHHEM